jgi:hypothetical protein
MTKQGRVHPEGPLPPIRDADGRWALPSCTSGIFDSRSGQFSFYSNFQSRLEPATGPRHMASAATVAAPCGVLEGKCAVLLQFQQIRLWGSSSREFHQIWKPPDPSTPAPILEELA